MLKKSKVVRVHEDFAKMVNTAMKKRFVKGLANVKELNMVEASYLITKSPSTPNIIWELENLKRRKR